MEVIDTTLDVLEEATSLHYAVYSAAAVYVESNRQIYVLGGADDGMLDVIQISNALYVALSV